LRLPSSAQGSKTKDPRRIAKKVGSVHWSDKDDVPKHQAVMAAFHTISGTRHLQVLTDTGPNALSPLEDFEQKHMVEFLEPYRSMVKDYACPLQQNEAFVAYATFVLVGQNAILTSKDLGLDNKPLGPFWTAVHAIPLSKCQKLLENLKAAPRMLLRGPP
jgi:hypothetical protein